MNASSTPICFKIKFHEDWVWKLHKKIEFFVLLTRHQNCLDKSLLLYTYFFNISFNVLRPTFLNIYNLSFSLSPNIGKIRVTVGPKTNYFSYFMSSCTNIIALFNNFSSLISSQPRDKQNCARDFFPLLKYFLNN